LIQHIGHIALIVKDYDEAIDFYVNQLDFTLIEDKKIEDNKRWVLVAPTGWGDCSLLLARAANPAQCESIGNQTGGRVFLFLYTDDFWHDFHKMVNRNINFVRPPTQFDYGIVAVFQDLYGNLWDLIEKKKNAK
jgi:catechol 2,3-dioxygenase-like lactoylglutathione lyase family enzyme